VSRTDDEANGDSPADLGKAPTVDERDVRIVVGPHGQVAPNTPDMAVSLPIQERSAESNVVAPEFGARYRVIGLLGSGGMGDVYRAHDEELQADVALKVLGRPDEATLVRFRREVALARRVSSPNVLRVYDIYEQGTTRFLSMEYVDGEDLAHLIEREKEIPVERAVSIFREVCLGVKAAHDEGVLHRDLKPQNVMVDRQGRVRVADFGLARALGETAMTLVGTVIGSPAYMSPEQVKGDDVDVRSDIYSLGVMLYEILTGVTPFRGDTVNSTMSMRLHKTPTPVRQINAKVPPHLERIVERCLAVDKRERYQTIAELLADLDANKARAPSRAKRRLVVPLLVLAAAGGGAIWYATKKSATGVAPVGSTHAGSDSGALSIKDGLITVLVLGIENRTGDPTFDGTLDVIFESALRRSLYLDPIAGSRLKTRAAELADGAVAIDEQLAVRMMAREKLTVVTARGSVVAKGTGFLISVTFKDVTGATVFAQSLGAASSDDVVATTSQLGAAFREKVGERVEPEERSKSGLSTNLEADHRFAIAAGLLNSGNEPGAAEYLEKALELDPEFAAAHMTLAGRYSNQQRRADVMQQYKLALKSIDLMGERDRLRLLGAYHLESNEADRAAETYEKLLEHWPTDIDAENMLSIAYVEAHKLKQAGQVLERARTHHPRDFPIALNSINISVLTGQFEHALQAAAAYEKTFPRIQSLVIEYVAVSSAMLGKFADAEAADARLVKEDASRGSAVHADYLLSKGRVGEAKAILEQGVVADLASNAPRAAEVKDAMLAEVHLRQRNKSAALASAAKVTTAPDRRYIAALVQLEAGATKRALATAKDLGSDTSPDVRVLGLLIEAERLRLAHKPADAIAAARRALALRDVWQGHYVLARVAIDAKEYAMAYSELQTVLERLGEVALATDDTTRVRYVPALSYYLALAQEGIQSAEATATFKAFVDSQTGGDPDPLVEDARRRLAAKTP
jgi:tetratricopeptide (TPR) repeat protein